MNGDEHWHGSIVNVQQIRFEHFTDFETQPQVCFLNKLIEGVENKINK